MVKGEGMPQYRNPFEKGDLYIKFDVQFPENNWISPEKLNVGFTLKKKSQFEQFVHFEHKYFLCFDICSYFCL